MPTTPTPHDALFRAAFGVPGHAADLLRAVLPANASAAIDWTTLARDPASYVDDDLRQRFSDLLFTARGAGGSRVLLYLLFEHQSAVDPDMPLRMLGYMVRIWERYRAGRPRGTRPPIVPVVLAHAPDGWAEPRAFEELFPADAMRVPG